MQRSRENIDMLKSVTKLAPALGLLLMITACNSDDYDQVSFPGDTVTVEN